MDTLWSNRVMTEAADAAIRWAEERRRRDLAAKGAVAHAFAMLAQRGPREEYAQVEMFPAAVTPNPTPEEPLPERTHDPRQTNLFERKENKNA